MKGWEKERGKKHTYIYVYTRVSFIVMLFSDSLDQMLHMALLGISTSNYFRYPNLAEMTV